MPGGEGGPSGNSDYWGDKDEPGAYSTKGTFVDQNAGGRDEGTRAAEASRVGAKSGAGPFQEGTRHAIESRRVGEAWVKGIASVIPGANLFMRLSDYARSKGVQVTEVEDDPMMNDNKTGKEKSTKASEEGARVRASVTAARRDEESEEVGALGSASLASRYGYSTGNRATRSLLGG